MNKQQDIFKKYLTTEVKYIIGIIVFVMGVVAPYYQIKEDIALIKQNHMAHIEAIQNEIKNSNEKYAELKEENNKQDETMIKLMQRISEIINNG